MILVSCSHAHLQYRRPALNQSNVLFQLKQLIIEYISMFRCDYLSGLDCKECEHSSCHVVIMELLFGPFPCHNFGRLIFIPKLKELALALICRGFANVGTIKELSIEQLNCYHSKDELNKTIKVLRSFLISYLPGIRYKQSGY